MAISSRIEGIAGGGRGSGGITGTGGKYVNPKYKEVGPTVKIIKQTEPGTRKALNAMEATRVSIIKSGHLTKGAAEPIIARNALGKPAKIIKINSK